MQGNVLLLIPILIPIIAGIVILSVKKFRQDQSMHLLTGAALLITTGCIWMLFLQKEPELLLWNLTDTLPIWLRVDEVGKYFAGLTSVVWALSGFFAFQYMHHEKNPHRFFGFYLITFGVLTALDFSGNIITFYLFYEMMTLVSVPLVVHSLTKEAIAASLKYLFYSLFGAFMGLLGIFLVFGYCKTLEFTPGGALDMNLVAGHETFILVAVMVMIIGFGTKAGMFPLHGWLPTAHPVAPAPASAVLSGIITKSGVLGIIRVLFYIVGPDMIRGTWVQTIAIILSLITVFMGSMMAFCEKGFKKRLAYSTVSQVSYVLFGLFVLSATAAKGAMLHIIFHSFIKNMLFLAAGSIIYYTGLTKVEEYEDIGKKLPVTMVCYTICSLSLVGIPPLSGFVSKWYLATGAYQAPIGVFSWLGPVILLISALLTAVYLLQVCIKGFFSKEEKVERIPEARIMIVPMIVYTVGTVLFGIFTSPLNTYLDSLLSRIF